MGWKLGSGPDLDSNWACSWSDKHQRFAGSEPEDAWQYWCDRPVVIYDDGYSDDRGYHSDGCCKKHLCNLPPRVLVELAWGNNGDSP